MKVAYIITRSDVIGGAQVHVRDLAVELTSIGHEPVVITGNSGPLTEQLSQHGIRYKLAPALGRAINPLRDYVAYRQVLTHLQYLQPEIVSTHSSKAGVIGRLAAHKLKIPVAFTAHGWSFTDGISAPKQYIYKAIERLAAYYSDEIITVSKYDLRIALEGRIAPSTKLTAIHNGMPPIPDSLMASPEVEPPRIIMVARFDQQKNQAALLKALAQLISVPWSLEFVGSGPTLNTLRAKATRLGLTNRIQFSGAQEDIPQRLANAQIFALTTNWEGFPRSILEAMRAGLPVIATDVGGITESVIDGTTGFVVPHGDHLTLTKQLKELLVNPAKRRHLGARGRLLFQENFRFSHMFNNTLEVYEKLLIEHSAEGVK